MALKRWNLTAKFNLYNEAQYYGKASYDWVAKNGAEATENHSD